MREFWIHYHVKWGHILALIQSSVIMKKKDRTTQLSSSIPWRLQACHHIGLNLKVNAIMMLLRNLSLRQGMCNGTQLRDTHLLNKGHNFQNFILAALIHFKRLFFCIHWNFLLFFQFLHPLGFETSHGGAERRVWGREANKAVPPSHDGVGYEPD